MTIMDHRALPVRADGATQDINDVIADALLLTQDVQDLARLGVTVSVTIEPGSITAGVALDRHTVSLLPSLVSYIGAPGLTYPKPGQARAVGTMCEGRISVTVTAPDPAQVTSQELRTAINQALAPVTNTAPGRAA
ncbi:hypothetical protein [Streptomyces syringium]|uniref:hypothetical protein n=1 Tax=Streptomyces syringium TaxID=76729 RepID=UPI0037D30778